MNDILLMSDKVMSILIMAILTGGMWFMILITTIILSFNKKD